MLHFFKILLDPRDVRVLHYTHNFFHGRINRETRTKSLNEAHKKTENLMKNKKMSKLRRIMHFRSCILKPPTFVALKCGEKGQNLGTFRAGHWEVIICNGN